MERASIAAFLVFTSVENVKLYELKYEFFLGKNLHFPCTVPGKTLYSYEGSDLTMMQNSQSVQISFPLAARFAFLAAYQSTYRKRKDFPLAPFQQFFREFGNAVLIPTA